MEGKEMDVYISKMTKAEYPQEPFAPERLYPELEKLPYEVVVGRKNEVYGCVRKILEELGLDKENQGSAAWNPLKTLVKPGQKVLIKPNLVRGEHPYGNSFVESMITHASVIRPLIDYVLLATEGEVHITIGDVPLQDCRWKDAVAKSGISALIDFYRKQKVRIELVDMRLEKAYVNKYDIVHKKIKNVHRDKTMYTAVDLGRRSELIDIIQYASRFEITDYKKGSVRKHHNRKKNEYFIPNEVLEADLFINVPKLKTHRKAGYTCAMKNLIGINGDKSWIAHHTRGIKRKNGDEFNKLSYKTFFKVRIWNWLKLKKMGVAAASLLKMFFIKFVWKGRTYKQISAEGRETKIFFEGSWYGNDTLWRCIKDLNKIILFADREGKMHVDQQRNYLCIADAVWAGEKEGPMEQMPKPLGIIFGGKNPVYVDYAAVKLMKYNYREIPVIRYGFENRWWKLVDKHPQEVEIGCSCPICEAANYFEPSAGWKEKLYEYEN